MDRSHVAQTIINTLSLAHHYPNVYFLGPTAERVSFASQQRRALNLIWALNETKKLTGYRVGIVGGGLAGITSAAAAIACGADVWLFEAAPELCALQREVDKRFIHPTINFWPDEPLSSVTHWPFLNWFAAPTREVIYTVERQWKKEFESAATVERGAKVHTISSSKNIVRLTYGNGNAVRDFDIVVVAVGFGPERGLPHLEADSYWIDNEIDRTKITEEKHIWISGTGDGALIDCLRICFGGFDRGKLLIRAATNFGSLKETISQIEKDAGEIEDLDARSMFLEDKYMALVDRPTVKNFLSKELAKVFPLNDSAPSPLVSLVHRAPSPFDYRTAPIHRILLALALKEGLIRPVRGEVESNDKGGILKDCDGGTNPIIANKIILRHGASGALKGLITDKAIEDLWSDIFRLHENSLQTQQWPIGYYENLTSATFSSPTNKIGQFLAEAVAVLRGALLAHDIAANCSVGISGEFYELIVQVTDGSSTYNPAIPSQIFGMKVRHTVVSVMPMLHGWTSSKEDSLKIFPGALVAFGESSDGFRWYPLTCLTIEKSTNDILGLCVTHQCNAAVGAPVYLRLPRGEKLIGKVSRTMLFNGSLEVGKGEDVACILFEVESTVLSQPAPDGMYLSGILNDPIELLNTNAKGKVKKWGAGPVNNEGTVSSVAGLVRVGTNFGQTMFADVISVESTSTFSQPGDSGSLVVTHEAMAFGVIFAGTENLTFLLPLAKILERCEVNLLSSSVVDNTPDSQVLLELGWLRLDQSRLDESEKIFQQVLTQLESHSIFHSSEIATAKHGLGVVLNRQARHAEAEPLLRQALYIRQLEFGEEHPKVVSTLQTLAYACGEQGKFLEAEEMFRRIIEIRQKINGPADTVTGSALKGLGWALRRQGRFQEAAIALKHSLIIWETSPDLNHRNTHGLLLELAWLAADLGNLDEAKAYFERTLEVSDDPKSTATAKHGLGVVLNRQARHAEAEPLLRQALYIRQLEFGEEHPKVVSTLQTLAYACGEQGKFLEAEEIFRRIIEIRQKINGPADTVTGAALKGLGWALRRQGRLEEATRVLKHSLTICETSPDLNHRNTHGLLLELAWLAADLGNLDEAKTYFERTLEASDNRNSTAAAMHGLGVVLNKQARPVEAEPLLRQALELRKLELGEKHPDVANTLQTLAYTCGDQGKFQEAEEMFRQAVEIRQQINGRNHVATGAALKGLGWTLRRQLRFDEADAILQKISKISTDGSV